MLKCLCNVREFCEFEDPDSAVVSGTTFLAASINGDALPSLLVSPIKLGVESTGTTLPRFITKYLSIPSEKEFETLLDTQGVLEFEIYEDESENCTKSESAPAPHLPDDIIADIFLGLPLDCIARFRTLSKKWNLLLSGPAFIRMRYNVEVLNNTAIILVTQVFSPHAMFLIKKDSVESRGICRRMPYPQESIIPRIVNIIGCSMGVLCLRLGRDYSTIGFCLWNPIVKDVRKLPRPPVCQREIIFGFCYDDKTSDFKIVRVVQDDEVQTPGAASYHFQVHVFSLISNSWRVVDGTTSFKMGLEYQPTIYFNHGVHWLAGPRQILYFHIHQEHLGTVNMPPITEDEDFLEKKIGLLHGSMCFLTQNMENGEVHLWLLKEYEGSQHWSEVFSTRQELLRRTFCLDAPLGFLPNGDLVFLNDLGIVVHRPGKDQARRVVLLNDEEEELDELLEATSYVGSLYPLN
ncbi:F-box protein CPR1-like [Papaver somniferum]|uniref:F-box protein CPR1-like n=1 Tax=Papaver somniferum TaxID=3469 RepID=UPI000E6F587C|nr:F-box protein CPR1-like [Papaver somniferum]